MSCSQLEPDVLCNIGLWITTLSLSKKFKTIFLISLTPTFLIAPLLVASRYHIALGTVAVVAAVVGALNLFTNGRDT